MQLLPPVVCCCTACVSNGTMTRLSALSLHCRALPDPSDVKCAVNMPAAYLSVLQDTHVVCRQLRAPPDPHVDSSR
jgi:hypothetical protein